MLENFLLAVALVCPNLNTVAVTEVLHTKTVTFEECQKMLDENHAKYRRKDLDSNGCEQDLLCIYVYWEGTPEPNKKKIKKPK